MAINQIVFFLDFLLCRSRERYETGQGLVEYALIILLIVVIVIGILGFFGETLSSLYQRIVDGLP